MIFARNAYIDGCWRQDVLISVVDGRIARVVTGATAPSEAYRVDLLLPALSNLHSHTFQRAMAGQTEMRDAGQDSFWTWRRLMYRYLDRLTPDHVVAIAELAFLEMLEAGYAAVAEFHYIHHAPGGTPYDDPAELSRQVIEAARRAGIGLTHLPVLYSFGGLDKRPLEGGQLRFGNALDGYLDLVDACRSSARDAVEDTKIGIAPHSLRAVSEDQISDLLAACQVGPVHIHIAEQTAEVDAVQSALKARPVEWLMAHADVDDRWCLIHATHMTETETRALANTRAVAGLCPVTEANLGDGVFPGADYLAAQGRFGVGTDSNVKIAVSEELRTLEYGQRLIHRARNVMTDAPGSVGAVLYETALSGGAQALGRDTGGIVEGKLADLVALDHGHPSLLGLTAEQILDGWIFAADDQVVTDLWSAGRHMVRQGRHVDRDRIIAAFARTMTDLREA